MDRYTESEINEGRGRFTTRMTTVFELLVADGSPELREDRYITLEAKGNEHPRNGHPVATITPSGHVSWM